MASQGPRDPASAATDSAGGTVDWTPGTETNIFVSDNTRATVLVATGQESYYLKATNFGFTVPAGATINGIVVDVERSLASGAGVHDGKLRIIKGGVIGATDRADTTTIWPATTDGTVSYGSSSDLWGETWSSSDVNGSTFGVALTAVRVSGATVNTRVDNMRITVHYTAAAAASLASVRRADRGLVMRGRR